MSEQRVDLASRFYGHERGVVVTQPRGGEFFERPMTLQEMTARAPAAAIQDRIYEFANTAGVCYYPIWELITDAIEKALRETWKRAPFSFQQRVGEWMQKCFGPVISADTKERNHRFLEEALELVQSCGCTPSEAHQLVDYVFGRPVGDKVQETGGVMVTLAALTQAHGIAMFFAGEQELTRVWTKIETIRAKQAAKPKHSPLP